MSIRLHNVYLKFWNIRIMESHLLEWNIQMSRLSKKDGLKQCHMWRTFKNNPMEINLNKERE